MKNHKSRSFLYSLLLHGVIVGLVIALVITTHREEKVLKERCHVISLAQCHDAPPVVKPTPVLKKERPPKKRKPLKKVVKKKVPKKVVHKQVPLKKAAPIKEEKVVEKVVEPEPVEEVVEEIIEEPVEAPKAVVVTPTEEAVLTPAAQEKVEAPPTPESTPEERYIKEHISKIMALLRKNLYYPRMARKRHIQGKVMVSFELMPNGDIRNITIEEAKREILGRAAVTTIERLEGKFPLPSESLILHVPIMYQLK